MRGSLSIIAYLKRRVIVNIFSWLTCFPGLLSWGVPSGCRTGGKDNGMSWGKESCMLELCDLLFYFDFIGDYG